MKQAQRFPALTLSDALLSLGLALLALIFLYTDWLWRWDLLLYDLHLKLVAQAPPDDIVVIAVDDRSLSEIGRWPWSRRVHASLITRLQREQASAIAITIAFPAPAVEDIEGDILFVKALHDSANVVLPVLLEAYQGQLLETLPFSVLSEATAALGHMDVELDRDGIVRGTFLKAGIEEPVWPHLSLALLQLQQSAKLQNIPGVRNPQLNQFSRNSWVRDHWVLIPFAGPPGHFEHIAYVDVINGIYPERFFHDKVVIVGVTATGLGDTLATPVSGQSVPMSGAEINANLVSALRQQQLIKPLADDWRGLLTVLLVLLTMVYSFCSSRGALLTALLLLLATLLLSMTLLVVQRVWFAPAPALLFLSLSYPLWSWRRLEMTVRSLFEEKERVQVTLHSIGDAVISTDEHGLINYMNPMAEKLTGYTLAAARRQPLNSIFRVIDEHSRELIFDPVAQCLRDNVIIQLNEASLLVNRYSKEFNVLVSAAPIHDYAGRVIGVVFTISDISAARQMTKQIAYQATHDMLTRLPNRNLFHDRLHHAIDNARRNNYYLAILFIDLDRFKMVNDSLGHSAGDRLLIAVAERFQTHRRKGDTVARLGGDEFVIILENLIHDDDAATVASDVLEALKTPFVIDSREFVLGGSIGVSVFPKDGEDSETLLKNADTAMYRAKDSGRNNIKFYAQDMNNRVLERLELEQQLRYALSREELILYYQPQLELVSGYIVGVEALVRWHHPEHGLISPAQFIPMAEETGLIIPIGEWVLETACQQAQAWQCQGLAPIRMAINLSPRQFSQQKLIDKIAQVLEQTGLSPDALDLEITESLIMKDVEGAIATLKTLKTMGVSLSIDDFGTGYSSLNYLKQFPIDYLKIDQSFVKDVTNNSDDAAIAMAIIALAHNLGVAVIAEGVETAQQLEFLHRRGCNEIQGFYFSKPLEQEAMTNLLRAKQRLKLPVSKPLK